MKSNFSSKKKSYFIILLCVICVPFSFSQNRITDSLLTLLKNDKNDTNKIIHLNSLGWDFLYENPDTSTVLSNQALDVFIQLPYSIRNGKRGKHFLAQTYGNLAVYQTILGNYTVALDFYLKALKLDEELGDKTGIAKRYGNIGLLYMGQEDYPQALEYLFKALKISEELRNKDAVAKHLGNIGNAYLAKADIFKQSGNLNLANRNYTKALGFHFKALMMKKNLNNKTGIAITLGNIGDTYFAQGDYTQALDYLFRSLKLDEELENKVEIATMLSSIGQIYISLKKYKEACNCLQRSVGVCCSIGAMNKAIGAYSSLSLLYEKSTISLPDTTGGKLLNMEQMRLRSMYYFKRSTAIKEMLASLELKKQMVRKEMNYQFNKKESATKAEQDKKDVITATEKNKQNFVLILVSCVLLLVFLFAGFVLRTLRITSKQKNIIELQKNEVHRQKEIVEKQNLTLEMHQKEIIDSITYAKHIQTALLTSDEYIKNNLPAEYFILFKPKDIVSGDFYWALSMPFLPGWDLGTNKVKLQTHAERKHIFYIATADCTGHGVPGAFMSMLNISYLNENVIERGIRLPHDILNSQRKEIIQALNPMGSTEESNDGMDCALCVFDFDKMLLHFALANTPLWLIRSGELTEYKADKMPVGKHNDKIDPFTLHTLPLLKGDIVYTSTDGYADQFGVNGKKLLKKIVKKELLKIHHLPMIEQKQYLDQYFENWKGDIEQVDDVCIIGIRI